MPCYFYHLAIEVLADPSLHAQPRLAPDLDIFSNELPTHSTGSWASYLAPRRNHRRSKTAKPDERSDRTVRQLSLTRHRPDSDQDRARERSVQARESAWSALEAHPCAQELTPRLSNDYRYDRLLIESIEMESPTITALERAQIAEATQESLKDVESTASGIRGRYIPSPPRTTEVGCGVVHLYRDAFPSSELDEGVASNTERTTTTTELEQSHGHVDKDCTTLCILAVPSYMTPSDLLGWLGEETRELVSHFRLVRTSRSNRYMVLLKFREPAGARKWQKDWNGRLFNSMEPENCHIVFVKSIRFEMPKTKKDSSSFPDMTNDPFTPDRLDGPTAAAQDEASSSLTMKPAPPPTPALVELPTCPVCLERMDETTGLATIFCQHVFHCACLQKWQGSGCPVCRYTQDDPLHKLRRRHERTEEDQCSVCGITDSLWICLVCGQVGCGRYDEAHAHAHFEQTGHTFAMDIKTQAIWDYASDEWVHRLIQNKLDGKLLELPSATKSGVERGGDSSYSKEKLEDVSMEYTSLLKGQLDSQRSYFEEQVDRAVDKAAKAALEADQATARALKATERLDGMQASHQVLLNETLPGLEKGKERAERRADKFETLARKMEKEWKEDKVINESLMDRIAHLEKQVGDMTVRNSDLEEQNRDLSFFISGAERLKGQGEDVQEGTLEVAQAPQPSGKKKRKGKGKTT